jgi:hypothetical protein
MKIGVCLRYYDSSLYKEAEKLKNIFSIVDTISGALNVPFVKLRAIESSRSTKITYTSPLQYNPHNVEAFIADIQKKTFKTILFYSGNFDNPISLLSIDIAIDDVFTTYKPQQRLELSLIDEKKLSINMLSNLEILASIVSHFVYGYIFYQDNKTSLSSFNSQLTWIPRKVWNPNTFFNKDPLEQELLFYQKHVEDLDTYIPKAYWGIYLNKNHVKTMGGLQKIKREAPVFLVEEFTNGAYMQLTEHITDVTYKDYKEKLILLDKYLSPITLPARPEVMWDNS